MANNIFFEEQPEQDFDLVPDEDQIDVSLDPDPLFDDGARPRRSRKRTGILIAGGCAVLALLCIGVYFIVSQARASREIAAQAAAEQDEERIKAEMALQQSQEYEAIVNATTFLEGVTVEGIAIGGKTMTEAETLLSEVIESKKLSGTLPLTYGDKTYSFDLSGVSITTNLSDVLAQAFQLARSGGVEDVLAEAEDIRTNGKAYTLTIQYDFTSVNTQVAALALEIDQPAQSATFGQIDKEKHTVAVVEATGGVEVDQEALTSAITAALMGGDYTTPIEIPVKETPPTLTGDAFELISTSAETSFSGSTSNRKYNIRKGADLINGTVLKPGETFSTNGVLGTRTLANGWKMANAYVSGATEEQAGGGVCQLSSTLYNAVVKADLEIVSRRNHSMPVNYMRKGLDATINSVGNIIDFKFRNDTPSDVVIFAWTSGNTVYFKIYRCQFDTDEYDEIRLTSEKLETIYPSGEMEEELDPSLAPGEEEIVVNRRNGERWQSYKNYYKDGKLVRSEKLAVSTYSAFAGKKLVGPSPSPSASVTPSAPATPGTPAPITPEPVAPAETPAPAPTEAPTNTPQPTEAPTPEPAPQPDPTQAPTAEPDTPPAEPETVPPAPVEG